MRVNRQGYVHEISMNLNRSKGRSKTAHIKDSTQYQHNNYSMLYNTLLQEFIESLSEVLEAKDGTDRTTSLCCPLTVVFVGIR